MSLLKINAELKVLVMLIMQSRTVHLLFNPFDGPVRGVTAIPQKASLVRL